MELDAKVLISFLDSCDNWKSEMLIKLALDQRPWAGNGPNTVVEDDPRFSSDWLPIRNLAIALKENLNAQ
jgi:hypothetical protein